MVNHFSTPLLHTRETRICFDDTRHVIANGIYISPGGFQEFETVGIIRGGTNNGEKNGPADRIASPLANGPFTTRRSPFL